MKQPKAHTVLDLTTSILLIVLLNKRKVSSRQTLLTSERTSSSI